VAEALWMQALEEGRRRALVEQRMTDRALAHDKDRLELRSHVLTLREGEMEARLQDRDRTISELESRVQRLTGLLQKEQASRHAVERRLSAVEGELSAVRQVSIRHRETAVKVAHRITRSAAKRRQAPTARKRKQTSRGS
jgi:hypothetical protein